MGFDKKTKFSVISNSNIKEDKDSIKDNKYNYQSNPIYQKLLNFKNLQDSQKTKFSVDDLFKLC